MYEGLRTKTIGDRAYSVTGLQPLQKTYINYLKTVNSFKSTVKHIFFKKAFHCFIEFLNLHFVEFIHIQVLEINLLFKIKSLHRALITFFGRFSKSISPYETISYYYNY